MGIEGGTANRCFPSVFILLRYIGNCQVSIVQKYLEALSII